MAKKASRTVKLSLNGITFIVLLDGYTTAISIMTSKISFSGYNSSAQNVAMAKGFQLLAGHPALDFANTLDYRYEPARSIELLNSGEDLLRFGLQSGLLTAAEARKIGGRISAKSLDSARALREMIERIFTAAADARTVAGSDLEELNAWINEAAAHQSIVRGKDAFVWTWRKPAGVEDLLWRIAQAAAELLTSPDLWFVRRCDAQNCRWLFLDKSKSHSRRWCDMKICGNREKARAYYRRTSSEA